MRRRRFFVEGWALPDRRKKRLEMSLMSKSNFCSYLKLFQDTVGRILVPGGTSLQNFKKLKGAAKNRKITFDRCAGFGRSGGEEGHEGLPMGS